MAKLYCVNKLVNSSTTRLIYLICNTLNFLRLFTLTLESSHSLCPTDGFTLEVLHFKLKIKSNIT